MSVDRRHADVHRGAFSRAPSEAGWHLHHARPSAGHSISRLRCLNGREVVLAKPPAASSAPVWNPAFNPKPALLWTQNNHLAGMNVTETTSEEGDNEKTIQTHILRYAKRDV